MTYVVNCIVQLSIVDSRSLFLVSDQKDVICKWQAGLKKNQSTVNHMFILLAAIQNQFPFNRKLYVLILRRHLVQYQENFCGLFL